MINLFCQSIAALQHELYRLVMYTRDYPVWTEGNGDLTQARGIHLTQDTPRMELSSVIQKEEAEIM